MVNPARRLMHKVPWLIGTESMHGVVDIRAYLVDAQRTFQR